MAGDETLSEGEHFVLRLHPHWKTLLRPFFILLVILVAAIAALVMLPSGTARAWPGTAIGIAVFLAVIVWGVVPVLRWQTTSYELTTRRLRLREGILSRIGPRLPADQDQRRDRSPTGRSTGCSAAASSSSSPPASTASSSSTRFPTSSRCSPPCSSWSRTSKPGWPGKIADPVH